MTFVNSYRQLYDLATGVHGHNQPFGIVEMRREAGVVVEAPAVQVTTFAQHRKRLLQPGQPEKELYMQLGVTSSPGMRVSDVSHAWAFGVDFDEGLPNLCRPGKPLEPTWLIETSPDRHHGVFLLERSVDADRLGRLARGVARRLDGDMAFAKPNQMVRVPASPNQKYEDVWVQLGARRGPSYEPDWLWTACDIDLYEASNAWIAGASLVAGQSGTEGSSGSVHEHAREAAMFLATKGWAQGYDTWFKVVVNLAALGEAGRAVAHEFSKAAPTQYEPADVDARFDRWLRDGTGDVKTLFGIAQREGWENPGPGSFDGATPKAAVSDRDIGRRLANQLQDRFAAIDIPGAPKATPPAFLKWNGESYELLDDRSRRHEIEGASKHLAAQLPAGTSSVAAALLRNIGSNRSLDTVCEHVAEALVPLCDPRVVRHYPYLPVQNGVLNLLTRELVPPYCRAIPLATIHVAFDPSATAPRFRAFLLDVLLGDERLIGYLKRLLGYSLLGKPKEQVFPIFLGPTAGNGKSVIFDVLLEMLGPFAARLKTEAIMQKSHVSDGANPAIAALAGKRLVIAAEPNDKHRFDTSTVKQLVGERSTQVRNVYASSSDMRIEFVLVMTANRMPYTAADDHGMWRRLQVVQFNKTVRGKDIDRDLIDKLLQERSGILNFLLEGIAEYFEDGLNPPPSTADDTAALRAEADPLTIFVEECCDADAGCETALKDLWATYSTWAETRSEFPKKRKSDLATFLKTHYGDPVDRRHLPHYQGVRLISHEGEPRGGLAAPSRIAITLPTRGAKSGQVAAARGLGDKL